MAKFEKSIKNSAIIFFIILDAQRIEFYPLSRRHKKQGKAQSQRTVLKNLE